MCLVKSIRLMTWVLLNVKIGGTYEFRQLSLIYIFQFYVRNRLGLTRKPG